MINGGYILQPRKLDESDVFRMPPVTRELWLYILRKVCYKDNKALKKGQRYFRFSQIQKDLSWHVGYRIETYSKPQLTKSLRRLREGNMIETTKATHGILVTVLKFGYYQNPANYEGNNEGNDEGNTKETEGSQYTKEGIKKGEERRKKNTVIFDEFWKKYHRITGLRKTDKDAALKYWSKLSANEKQKAIECIIPFYNSLENPQFCKKARSYLSGKNFNDEFKETETLKLVS
jgi:hypothetical protein